MAPLPQSHQTGSEKSPAKPLLIYDGDCGFCVYWARYWQKLTGDSIQYEPYQTAAPRYPEIPVQSFQQAVQYITPEGKVASAAEASFLTLSHAPGKKYWLSLYRRLPGFAFISEKTYAFIASHRTGFYRISLLLWGRNYTPPRHEILAWLFLRLFGVISLIAFYSFGTQALGLIGSQGIVPLTELTQIAHDQLGMSAFWQMPMLFWFNTSDTFIQAICWTGGLASLCLIFNILPRASLIFIYIFYLSLMYGGQLFMTFQWDLLLIETSMIAFFLVRSPVLGIWLLRWLLFRFMFAAGLVKIMSGDPSWWDFTALFYHFYTQPLPTPIAWYVQQLPESLLMFGAGMTLVIELIIPFFIFFPRRLRFIAGLFILILQICILLTGNYNFFNLLTILICMAVLDDAALQSALPKKIIHALKPIQGHSKKSIYTYFAASFAVITVCVSIIQFDMRFTESTPAALVSINRSIEPLRLVSTYGPFAVMTKNRYEIIFEGSNDGITWHTYTFKYKPGDIQQPPLWNIPFQPRLDWQMWFASLGSINENPWVLRFMQRLLENSPHVMGLLKNNPFPYAPPIYVRALFYEYSFTNFAERNQNHAWWKRHLLGYYMRDTWLQQSVNP